MTKYLGHTCAMQPSLNRVVTVIPVIPVFIKVHNLFHTVEDSSLLTHMGRRSPHSTLGGLTKSLPTLLCKAGAPGEHLDWKVFFLHIRQGLKTGDVR